MRHSPLGNNVQKHRKAAQLTQAKLAAAVGVTRQPSVRLALQLSRALAVPVEQLFYET